MAVTLPQLPETDPSDGGPFVVIAKHRAVPGTADQLERRMLFDLANTRAEHGCLQFHIHRDRADRDLFVIYEVWRDVEALKTHFVADYVQAFVRESAPFEAGEMDVQFLTMSSPYAVGRS
jgi:quinol monooxygenase YgiN